MVAILDDIGFKDAVAHTRDQIKQSNLLLSKGVCEYKGIDVAENKRVWSHLRRVAKTARRIDRFIKQS